MKVANSGTDVNKLPTDFAHVPMSAIIGTSHVQVVWLVFTFPVKFQFNV